MLNLPKITTVVLTKDEADNISRCLKSVLWTYEILLIDNSHDKTVKIAQKIVPPQNLRVFSKKSVDFASLRNFAMKEARGDWILHIDADEEVTLGLKQEILQATKSGSAEGYFIPRKDFFMGKWLKYGETGNIKLLKLGKKDAGVWKRSVHETWDIPKTAVLKSSLNHFPHPSVAEFIERVNRWTDMNAVWFHREGIKSSFWQIISYPLAKFLVNYFIKQGFRDGMQGMIMAMVMSFHSFLTRAKLYMLQHETH